MRTTLPAGAGEIMQYIVHPFNDNTIRFVLRYPGRLDPVAMQQAALGLCGSVDVLHAAFEAGSLRARWRIHPVRPANGFTCIEAGDAPLDAALDAALSGIRAQEPVKLRCILVTGSTESAVALLISHLCADGIDGRYLLNKLCEAYNLALTEGSCRDLSVKQGSREAGQVYRRLSRKERRRLLRDPRTGIRTVFPFPEEGPGVPASVRRLIPAAVMTAAHARAREMGATLNDLLLAACFHACAETAGFPAGTPLSLMSMMDLRRHLPGGDSPGLCNLTGGMATALPQGLPASLTDTLREVAAQTRRAKEDPLAGLYGMPLLHGAAKRLPLKLLLAVSSRVYGSMAVGLTNVGRMDSAALALGALTPTEAWFGGPVKKKPGMQVSCMSLDNACALSIWGHAGERDRAVLQQLLDDMARHVQAFADGTD